MASGDKSPDAFKTIGELSQELGVAQHILRYWETRFPQLKPMQRAGNRRYYRPADVDLVRKIHHLLNEKGYTVRGVQQLLRGGGVADAQVTDIQPPASPPEASGESGISRARLTALRDKLAAILDG